MSDTSEKIFTDMRLNIVEVLTEDWSKYLETVTAAYDTAYSRMKELLGEVQAAIIERHRAQQALMVGVLSVVTGGVVGVFAEKLAKRLVPEAEMLETTAIYTTQNTLMVQVTKVAGEDPVLFKILRDTTKDAVKKGGDKLTELGLDKFKGEGPSDGFKPNGLSVADYRRLLNDGITDRAKFLTFFAKLLYQASDLFPAEVAESLRAGMQKNEFFDGATRKHVRDVKLLTDKAELALWCAWALARDEDWWEKQVAVKNYGPSMSEVYDWNAVREELVRLGVPEDPITVVQGFGGGFRAKKGLDVIGLLKWARSVDAVHTLNEGIPIAGGDPHGWAKNKMLELAHMAITAA